MSAAWDYLAPYRREYYSGDGGAPVGVMYDWAPIITSHKGIADMFFFLATDMLNLGIPAAEIGIELGKTGAEIQAMYLQPGQDVFEGKKFYAVNKEKVKRQIIEVEKLTGINFEASMSADWHFEDLARRIAAFDIVDIRELSVREVAGTPQYFNNRTGRVISGIGEKNGAFASVNDGAGFYTLYICQITNTGIPIFKTQKIKTGVNVWPMLIGIVLAFIGVPVLIGSAVLGPATAAAYPALASGIGNIAIQTVLSGGDFEQAIKSGVAGYAAGFAGGAATAASGVQAVGTVTAAVAKAALLGQNLNSAALSTAINAGFSTVTDMARNITGASNMSDYDSYDFLPDDWWIGGDVNILDPNSFPDWGNWDASGQWAGLTSEQLGLQGIDISGVLMDPDFLAGWGLVADSVLPDAAGNLYNVMGEFVSLDATTWYANCYFDEYGNILTPSNTILLGADEITSITAGAGTETEELQMLSEAAYERINGLANGLVATAPASGNRPATAPQAAPQTKAPEVKDFWSFAGAFMSATTNYLIAKRQIAQTGMYRPTYAVGAGTTYPQVAGMPIVQADGTRVLNNGNGTITTTYPDGRVITTGLTPPGATVTGQLIPGISNTMLMIGAAGLVGVAIVMSKR